MLFLSVIIFNKHHFVYGFVQLHVCIDIRCAFSEFFVWTFIYLLLILYGCPLPTCSLLLTGLVVPPLCPSLPRSIFSANSFTVFISFSWDVFLLKHFLLFVGGPWGWRQHIVIILNIYKAAYLTTLVTELTWTYFCWSESHTYPRLYPMWLFLWLILICILSLY